MTTQTSQSDIKRFPKLRFLGFSDGWEEKSIGELGKIITGSTPSTLNRTFYGDDYMFVSPVDIEDNHFVNNTKTKVSKSGFENGRKVKEGSVLFVCIGSTIGKIAQSGAECITNQQINSIEANKYNSNDFIFFKLKYISKRIKLLAGSQAVPMINKTDFSIIRTSFPSLLEQQKIASFLSSIDKLIDNFKNQKKNLESYKKGMIKNIFLQEIKFKDKDNKAFPKWELKKLSDIGKTYNGLQAKSGEDFGTGKPFITYKQIFDSSEIDVNKFALVKVDDNERQNKAQFGDVFFTTSSETPGEVGFASVLLNKDTTPYLNSFSFGFRANSFKELDPYFAKFFFRSPLFRRDVVKLAQGSTRYNISKIEFMKIKILLPSILEQQKIAEFLSSIDKLVESKKEQIIQAEQWKKGLMQELFI